MAEIEPPSRDIVASRVAGRNAYVHPVVCRIPARKDGDTKDRLLINADEPKSMARADFEAACVNAQRLARALLEHKVGKVVILSCRYILAPTRAARKPPRATA